MASERRNNPPRSRKPNRLYNEEEYEVDETLSPKKAKMAPLTPTSAAASRQLFDRAPSKFTPEFSGSRLATPRSTPGQTRSPGAPYKVSAPQAQSILNIGATDAAWLSSVQDAVNAAVKREYEETDATGDRHFAERSARREERASSSSSSSTVSAKQPTWTPTKPRRAQATNVSPSRSAKKLRAEMQADSASARAQTDVAVKQESGVGAGATTKLKAGKLVTNAPSSDEIRTLESHERRLRNFLKLSKAHRWIFFERFYSNLDRQILLQSNEFADCVRELLPDLRTRLLTRAQWTFVRRLLGKPRRCSSRYFEEERAALERRRAPLRLLQNRKLEELESLDGLPEYVLQPIVVGMAVTARVRKPLDGLFTGIVEGYEPLSRTFRIKFDNAAFGANSMSIPDYEVASNCQLAVVPLSSVRATLKQPRASFAAMRSTLALQRRFGGSLMRDEPPASGTPPSGADEPLTGAAASASGTSASAVPLGGDSLTVDGTCTLPLGDGERSAALGFEFGSPMAANRRALGSGAAADRTRLMSDRDPLLARAASSASPGSPLLKARLLLADRGALCGNYPSEFLCLIVALAKILSVKKELVSALKQLNAEVEDKQAFGEPLPTVFQADYAEVVLQLERINRDLNEYMDSIRYYCRKLGASNAAATAQQEDSANTGSSSFEHAIQQVDRALDLRHHCYETAQQIVARLNRHYGTTAADANCHDDAARESTGAAQLATRSSDRPEVAREKQPTASRNVAVGSERLQRLIVRLVSVLLQLRTFAESDLTLHELGTIRDSLNELRESVDPSNLTAFQQHVEVHANHILSSINYANDCHVFHEAVNGR